MNPERPDHSGDFRPEYVAVILFLLLWGIAFIGSATPWGMGYGGLP